MSSRVYDGGVLRQQWDDTTRIYTVYNVDGTVATSRPYTAGENATADAETAQAAQITDLQTRVKKLEDYVFTATPPSTTPTAWAGSPVPPGGLITFAGSTWKNISGAWLISDPTVYPTGWSLQSAPTTVWAVGVTYKVSDHVTYNGSTYQCLTAHTSQTGWDPVDAPSLWQKL